jgi:hypothetical protein
MIDVVYFSCFPSWFGFLRFVLDLQEKSKKILDIWAKANTFPPAVLAGLTNVVQEAEKGAFSDSVVFSLSTSFTRVIPAIFWPHSLRNLKILTEIRWFVLCQSTAM